MATWDTDLVLMLRILINDYSAPQKNTDAYLKQVLVAAGILVNNDIDLTYDYTFDISNSTISPDPITSSDIMLQALLPLKAACILNQGSFQQALGQGIKVRDGDSQIDTSVSFRGYKDILQLGPCASYEKLLLKLQHASASLVGGSVMSPYRGPNDSPIDTISWFYDQFSYPYSCNPRYGR